MTRVISALAITALLWPATVSAQAFSPQEEAAADRLVTDALAKSGVPSASIAVVRGGHIAFIKAYGHARLAPARPAEPVARYDIGSVSKQFTATLVLMLADEGRINLDDKVGRFLPGVAGAGEVTVRQVLAQTTGYPNYWVVSYLPPWMRQDVAPQAIVERWGAGPLAFTPGTRWQYSNTNYTIAGRIVEQVEGRPLAAVLQARIFDPLGMSSARVGPQPPFSPTDAAGYGRTGLGPARATPRVRPGWQFGAGGLSMTAEDLARWDMAMLGHRLLSPAGYRAQQTESRLADGSASHYGLGIYLRQVGGHRLIRHDGDALGFVTENRIYPDDGAAIAVMTNGEFGAAAPRIADGLQAVLLGPMSAAASSPAPTAAPRPVDPADTALARRILDDLAAGRLDRRLFTPAGAAALTPHVRVDLRATLARLGPPQAVELTRKEPWGGYDDATIHELRWPARKLVLIMFRTRDGRVDDYNLFSPD